MYKAYIKDTKSLNNLILPLLFSDANELNLRLILKDLPILTRVGEIIIIYICAASNINILAISALLARIY